MNTTILTVYVLIWPVLTAMVLVGLCWNVWRDLRNAKRMGEDMV